MNRQRGIVTETDEVAAAWDDRRYIGQMADTITLRLDKDAARALAALTRDGTSVSTAVRAALLTAARERARTALRAEAEALAADQQDRAEAAQVLGDMEQLRMS